VWPVLEVGGRIVWMRGAELEPEPGIGVEATNLNAARAALRPTLTRNGS
jgi:hypothetical protein